MKFWYKSVSRLTHIRLKFQIIRLTGSENITKFTRDRFKKSPCTRTQKNFVTAVPLQNFNNNFIFGFWFFSSLSTFLDSRNVVNGLVDSMEVLDSQSSPSTMQLCGRTEGTVRFIWGRFHQHFMSSFYANILAQNKYKPKM